MKTLMDPAAEISALIEKASSGEVLAKNRGDLNLLLDTGNAFCLKYQGKIVAFAGLYDLGDCIEIGSVVTDPDYRRLGYASKVVASAIKKAQHFDRKPIIAIVNDKSQPLFEKLGFVPATKKPVSGNRPCKAYCQEIGRWPKCQCNMMILK